MLSLRNQIAALCKSSSSKCVYFDRNGNDWRLMTTYSGLSYNFTGAATSLSSTRWIFFGMSAGLMARNNDFMLWGYIYQAYSEYDQGIWVQTVSILASNFRSGSSLYVQFGTGLSGYLNDVYVVNHLEHFETFKLFKSSFGIDRYHCFDSNYNMDPHYISNGWGNGYMLLTESSETWDDQNTTGGDGCSSTCTREKLLQMYELKYCWRKFMSVRMKKWNLWANLWWILRWWKQCSFGWMNFSMNGLKWMGLICFSCWLEIILCSYLRRQPQSCMRWMWWWK